MANEDYLEQVRRLSIGEGFTEGGILKALAEAANQLKREDYQFQSQMNLKNKYYDLQEEQNRSAENTRNIGMSAGIFKVLSDLGMFGKPKIDPIMGRFMHPTQNVPVDYQVAPGSPEQGNWLQIMFGGLNDMLKKQGGGWD